MLDWDESSKERSRRKEKQKEREGDRMKLIVLGKFSSNNQRSAEPIQQSTRRGALSNHRLVLRQHLAASLELVVRGQHRRRSSLSQYNDESLREFVRVVLRVSTAFWWRCRCWPWPAFPFRCSVCASVGQAGRLAIDPWWTLPWQLNSSEYGYVHPQKTLAAKN